MNALGVALVVLGAVAAIPGLVFAGVIVLATTWLRALWVRYGLRGVVYERSLGSDRAVWGDQIPLDVTVWNRKLLPLAWLRADDHVSEEAEVRERPLAHSERPGEKTLVNTWTLAPFERVTRRFHLVADRRGMFRFDLVRLRVADLFARDTAVAESRQPATYIVRPRTVPIRTAEAERLPNGVRPATRGLFPDPSLYAGVRPYQVGDPLRAVHWRATARTGTAVAKRFDPSRTRETLIVLDVQTTDRAHWHLAYDEDLVESLCVVAGSLARRTLGDGSACGLAAAAYSSSPNLILWMPPSGGPDQLARIEDALGRMSSHPSGPFEALLASLPRRVAPGATIVTLSTREPNPYLPALVRLGRSGYGIRHIAVGGSARDAAARLRAVAIDATVATLSPDWRTCGAVVLGA